MNDFIEEIYAAFAAPQVGVPNKHLDRMSSIFDERYPRVDEDWQQISPKLMEAISLVRGHVYGINGDQRDVIDEDEFVNGLHSIRIGGDKLSRGLTLPGLMTSYFLRVSRMYDTLMQMGRWFGYRDKYQDICQISAFVQLFYVANASESLSPGLSR